MSAPPETTDRGGLRKGIGTTRGTLVGQTFLSAQHQSPTIKNRATPAGPGPSFLSGTSSDKMRSDRLPPPRHPSALATSRARPRPPGAIGHDPDHTRATLAVRRPGLAGMGRTGLRPGGGDDHAEAHG